MSLPQLWALAQAWYSGRLSPDWKRRSVDEIHALFASLGLHGGFWRFD